MTQYTAQNVVLGQAFVETVLAAYKVAPLAALTDLSKLRLSNDPTFNPTPSSTRAALAANECAYSGYAAGGIAVVLSAPVILSTVCLGVLFTALFSAAVATPFVADTATGWWIDDGTNMIAGERFTNNGTAGFGAPGNFLSLTAILPFQLRQATS